MAKQLKLEIPFITKTHLSNSHTKLIESRKLLIQTLIQHILIQEKEVLKQGMLATLNVNDHFFEKRNPGFHSKFLEGQNLSFFLHKLEQTGRKRILNYQIKPTITVIVKIFSLDDLQFSVGVNNLTVVGDLLRRLAEIL